MGSVFFYFDDYTVVENTCKKFGKVLEFSRLIWKVLETGGKLRLNCKIIRSVDHGSTMVFWDPKRKYHIAPYVLYEMEIYLDHCLWCIVNWITVVFRISYFYLFILLASYCILMVIYSGAGESGKSTIVKQMRLVVN